MRFTTSSRGSLTFRFRYNEAGTTWRVWFFCLFRPPLLGVVPAVPRSDSSSFLHMTHEFDPWWISASAWTQEKIYKGASMCNASLLLALQSFQLRLALLAAYRQIAWLFVCRSVLFCLFNFLFLSGALLSPMRWGRPGAPRPRDLWRVAIHRMMLPCLQSVHVFWVLVASVCHWGLFDWGEDSWHPGVAQWWSLATDVPLITGPERLGTSASGTGLASAAFSCGGRTSRCLFVCLLSLRPRLPLTLLCSECWPGPARRRRISSEASSGWGPLPPGRRRGVAEFPQAAKGALFWRVRSCSRRRVFFLLFCCLRLGDVVATVYSSSSSRKPFFPFLSFSLSGVQLSSGPFASCLFPAWERVRAWPHVCVGRRVGRLGFSRFPRAPVGHCSHAPLADVLGAACCAPAASVPFLSARPAEVLSPLAAHTKGFCSEPRLGFFFELLLAFCFSLSCLFLFFPECVAKGSLGVWGLDPRSPRVSRRVVVGSSSASSSGRRRAMLGRPVARRQWTFSWPLPPEGRCFCWSKATFCNSLRLAQVSKYFNFSFCDQKTGTYIDVEKFSSYAKFFCWTNHQQTMVVLEIHSLGVFAGSLLATTGQLWLKRCCKFFWVGHTWDLGKTNSYHLWHCDNPISYWSDTLEKWKIISHVYIYIHTCIYIYICIYISPSNIFQNP